MMVKKRITNAELKLLGGDRMLCSVLEDMRTCHKSRDYSRMETLIEEAQVYANRMEDGLYTTRALARNSFDYIFDNDPDLTKAELKKQYFKRYKFKVEE